MDGENLNLFPEMCNYLENKKIKYSVDGYKISIQYKKKYLKLTIITIIIFLI
jgi:hypothetical protein